MSDSDTDWTAALFLSPSGEIACFPDWFDDMGGVVGFERLAVSGAVAAGILRLIQERDEAKAVTCKTVESLIAATNSVDRLERECDEARLLLRECYQAVLRACCAEDGLDSSEGIPLMHRLEQLFPDLKAAAERDYRP